MNATQRRNRARGSTARALDRSLIPGTIIRGRLEGVAPQRNNASGLDWTFASGGYIRNMTAPGTIPLGVETLGASVATSTGAIARGASTFTASASVAPGVYWLGQRTLHGVGETADSNGEMIEVTSSGTAVALTRPLIKNHPSGATIRPIQTLSTGIRIRGPRFFGKNGVTLNHLYIGHARNVVVTDHRYDGYSGQGLYMIRCSDVVCTDAEVLNGPLNSVGLGYGIGPRQVVRGTFRRIRSNDSRHTLSLTRQCGEILAEDLSAGPTTGVAFDDHDICTNVTVRRVAGPIRDTTDSGEGPCIQIGNKSWAGRANDYVIENVTVDYIEIVQGFVNSRIDNPRCRFIQMVAGNATASQNNDGTSLPSFSQSQINNPAILGRTWHQILIGTNEADTTRAVEIDRLQFIGGTIRSGTSGTHVITVRGNVSGAFTNYSLRCVGTTITNVGGNTGARVVLQTSSATTPPTALRAEFTNCTIQNASGTGGGTSTHIFGRDMTGGAGMVIAVSNSTWVGAAIVSTNVQPSVGATFTGTVTPI